VGRRISSNDCSDYSGKVSEESTIYSIPAEVRRYLAITSHLRQVSTMEHRYCAGFYVLGMDQLLAEDCLPPQFGEGPLKRNQTLEPLVISCR
jgi:hypothetical protein